MGFGGGNNNAADEAQRAEDARLAAIRDTQGRVNAVFDSPSRQADIADFVGAMRTYYNKQLAEQATNSQRELDFALDRSGLAGGSTQIDQQRDFAEQHTKGVLEVERKALGAGAELEAADQDSRARLISLATAGLDSTTGAAQSAAAMRTNLQAGRAAAMADGLGNAFGSLAEWTTNAREAQERRRANKDAGFDVYGSGLGAWGGS